MLIFSTVLVPIAPGTFCRVSPAALESHLKSQFCLRMLMPQKKLLLFNTLFRSLFQKKEKPKQKSHTHGSEENVRLSSPLHTDIEMVPVI